MDIIVIEYIWKYLKKILIFSINFVLVKLIIKNFERRCAHGSFSRNKSIKGLCSNV